MTSSFRYLALQSLTAIALFATQTSRATGERNTAVYNLDDSKLGLKGYDPVAVFSEGGGTAQAGDPTIRIDYEGVTYQFISIENREKFAANPAKYEPTYGGWCAYAMASGSKVDIQPNLFTIHGNRAHYFVAARAKRNFDADIEGFEANADGFWRDLSGEDPR